MIGRLYPRTPSADEGKNLSWDDLNLVFALTMQWRSAPLSTTETTDSARAPRAGTPRARLSPSAGLAGVPRPHTY